MLRLALCLLAVGFASCYIRCPDGSLCHDFYTCCKIPYGYACCPYPNAQCCWNGYYCCAYGYRCDPIYTQCVRTGLRYPFTPKQASIPAIPISTKEVKSSLKETPMMALTEARADISEAGVIRCDSEFYCAEGTSCCKGPTGQWRCCSR